MTEHGLEKVIKGLEAHATASGCMKNCPYWEIAKLDCSQELAADALAILKAQEPCLMDFSDIQTVSKMDVYLEDRGSDLVYPLMLLGAENSNKSQAVFFHPMTVKPLSAYGKTWRCWTSRPTDEQRKAVKWG